MSIKPKISIITINYNNSSGLGATIQSVVNQSYPNIEYVVIDGDSSDNSLDIIKSYESEINFWISEPDCGIYNAMNKGLNNASGLYVLFLISGDKLHNDEVISKMVNNLDDYDLVYGNLQFISEKERFIRSYPKKLTFQYFLNNRSLPHMATLIKRSLFDKVFYYNEDYEIVSDWEFFICTVCKFNATYCHLDILVSDFDTNGVSNDIESQDKKQNERTLVLQEHFSTFIDDYEDITLLNNNRFKALKVLEETTFCKKLNSLWLRLVLFISKGKTPEQL